MSQFAYTSQKIHKVSLDLCGKLVWWKRCELLMGEMNKFWNSVINADLFNSMSYSPIITFGDRYHSVSLGILWMAWEYLALKASIGDVVKLHCLSCALTRKHCLPSLRWGAIQIAIVGHCIIVDANLPSAGAQFPSASNMLWPMNIATLYKK